MLRLIAALVAAFAFQARADVAAGLPEFTWAAPTAWTDGTAMTAAQLTGFRISCSPGGYVMRVAGDLRTFTVPAAERFAAGAYTCVLYPFGKYTPTTAETMGPASSPVSFTVPQPTPNAATGFSVK